jgi:hypothetical protein
MSEFKTKYYWQEFYNNNEFISIIRSTVKNEETQNIYEYIQIRLGERLPNGRDDITRIFNIPIPIAKQLSEPKMIENIVKNFITAVNHDEL